MKKYLLAAAVMSLAGLLAISCAKKEEPVAAAKPVAPEPPKPASVVLVKEQERSAHFMAVNQQLELGGTLYGYVDVDGDVLKVAGMINDVVAQMAATKGFPAPQ